MNRTYRLVFNKALGLVQVVSELANCRGKKSAGKTSSSEAHTGTDENSSAPFKLKAIAIASALTVSSFLIIASPPSFAQGITNFNDIGTLSPTGAVTGNAGATGNDGYYASNGDSGEDGFYNGYAKIGTLTNNATITGGAGGAGGNANSPDGRNGAGGRGGSGVNNFGYGGNIENFSNNATITGGIGGIQGTGAISNGGGGAGGAGIYNGYYSSITALNNNDSIIGGNGGAGVAAIGGNGGAGIANFGSKITALNNNGSITGGNGGTTSAQLNFARGGDGIQNGYDGGFYNPDTEITTLTNNGSITGGAGAGAVYDGFGISNFGSIVTLNNAQGGDGLTPATTALTYTGNLPTNYNIIINSQSSYGQLFATSVTGTMSFGISNLSVASNTIYNGIKLTSVLTGIDPTLVTIDGYITSYLRVSSLDSRYSGNLVYNGGGIWDLDILSAPIAGPSALDTQSSLQSLAPKLRGVFSSQLIATNFANMNTYDCDLFDAKGVCVSVGGQQTYVDNPSSNMTSTVVVAGYKVSPNIRIGGFLNQNINNNTVSGVHISNANPLMGVFAVWNQKEDRLGYQVKIANAYQDKDVTTTRDVIDSSEAGIGKTNLNTQSYVGELSYAFLANQEKTLVRPYTALRYTSIKQDGYTEQTSAGVTAPLTYAALADRSTTALVV